MVWVVDCDDIKHGSKFQTIWDDEESARKDICAMIVADINSEWDLNDKSLCALAKDIESYINLGYYRDAIRFWNQCTNRTATWSVRWESMFGAADVSHLGKINFPNSAVTNNTVTPASPTDPSDQEPITLRPSQNTTLGATCRGPCKNYNPYAYADRSDNSYMCRQCSTFKSIFGT